MRGYRPCREEPGLRPETPPRGSASWNAAKGMIPLGPDHFGGVAPSRRTHRWTDCKGPRPEPVLGPANGRSRGLEVREARPPGGFQCGALTPSPARAIARMCHGTIAVASISTLAWGSTRALTPTKVE